MNKNKFESTLGEYLKHCNSTDWINKEVYKFYFAHWLNKHVQLGGQQPNKILQACIDSQQEYFAPEGYNDNRGVQFLWMGARSKLNQFINLSDAENFKLLATGKQLDENMFANRDMSYPALSGWLGTLLPERFIPVPVSEFHKTISYLFDLNEFPKVDYKFFVQAQEYFQRTKLELKKFEAELSPLYLDMVEDYDQSLYNNRQRKGKYREVDWNWLTEDYHFFLLREHLGDDNLGSKKKLKRAKVERTISEEIEIKEEMQPLEIYYPRELGNLLSKAHYDLNSNTDLFELDYLEIHRKQIEIGANAEELVLTDEVDFLLRNGKVDLSKRVKKVSGDPTLGFDILSFELDGSEKQIEVKAIKSGSTKSFIISAHEFRKSKLLPNYYIYCIQFDNASAPKIIRLAHPDLGDNSLFKLESINYKVSFK